jgi:hypothetical protein
MRMSSLLVVSALGFFVTFANDEGAMAAGRFNNASLKGNYAVVDIGRGGQTPQAGVSVTTYDGKGSFSGVTVQDVPGRTFRERVFVRASFKGTYDVGENGTGTGVITTTLANGSTSDVNIALVITKWAKIGDDTVAEEFSFVYEQLGSTTGNLLTLHAARLPDEGIFTNASLRGEYAYTLLGHGGPLPQAGLGVMSYDGAGRFTGNATVNIPGAAWGERTFVSAPFVRPYTVNADGTGTATPPGESDIVFVITRAEVVDGVKLGTEVFFIVRELNPSTGNLLTGMITRLSD